MYAIIESGGKQFKVRQDGRVRVPSLEGQIGDAVTFDRVLYASDGETVSLGRPLLEGARVLGEIVAHGRSPKVLVFKYKRRHRYRRKRGHRQGYTEVAITGLELGEARGEAGRAERRQQPVVDAGEAEIGGQHPAGEVRQVGAYVCEDCGRGFATERGLQQHRAKAHVD